jgi:hypothetical protein
MGALREAVAFNDGFNNDAGDPASRRFLADMTVVQGRMAQYGRLLQSLSDSYQALGDFASYDAAGAFKTSVDALSSDTEKFASAVGKPITIPPSATTAVGTFGGLIISAAQAHKVKAASAQLETILKSVITIVEDPSTRAKLVPAEDQVQGQIGQAAASLYAHGAYSYEPVVTTLGSPLGFTPSDGVNDVAKNDPQIRQGLTNVVAQLADQKAVAVGDSYDASVAALKALVPLHEKLAKGAPLDLKQLTAIVDQLQSIAAALQPSTNSKPSGK